MQLLFKLRVYAKSAKKHEFAVAFQLAISSFGAIDTRSIL